jgi:hypothetical protein
VDANASGVTFTPDELDGLVRTLATIARNERVTSLGNVVTMLTGVAGTVAAHVTLQNEALTMTAPQYVEIHHMPPRTVRHQCQHGRLPCKKRENGRWAIKVQ